MRYAIFILLVILAAGAYFTYDAYTFLHTPPELPGREVTFEVEQGATFDRVAWDLKKSGLITDVRRFQILGRYKKAHNSIKAGEYILNTAFTPTQILQHLVKGQTNLVRLTIREGLSWWETAKAIEQQGFAAFEDFKTVIHDRDFLRKHAIPFDNAEGFLYPDTYLLNKPKRLDKAQAEYIASLLIKTFWQKNAPFWQLLEASPAPDELFGEQVKHIASQTSVNTVEKLAQHSYQSVMRAPLPPSEDDGPIVDSMMMVEDEAPADEPCPAAQTEAAENQDAGQNQTATGTTQPNAAVKDTTSNTTSNAASGVTNATPSAGANNGTGDRRDKQPASQVSGSPGNGQQDNKSSAPGDAQAPEQPQKQTVAENAQSADPTITAPAGQKKAGPMDLGTSDQKAAANSADSTANTPTANAARSQLNAGSNGVTTRDTGDQTNVQPSSQTSSQTDGHANSLTNGRAGSNANESAKNTASSLISDLTARLFNGTKETDGRQNSPQTGGQTEQQVEQQDGTTQETATARSHPADSWPGNVLPSALPSNPPATPAEIDAEALRQAITLASLVEKETGLPAERPRVAGVYANRIRKGMLLQCDPTIIYGVGPSFSGPIRRSQLQDKSNLYNTYLHPGLPPSPISSFGIDAFASAMLPEKHAYLYFVATGQGKDHTFSKTLSEHNRAVAAYRARIRNK